MERRQFLVAAGTVAAAVGAVAVLAKDGTSAGTEGTREVVRRWLFPLQTRHFQGSRALSISLRTLHIAAFSVLLGGQVFCR